jgi:hypothetical protein
MSAHVTGWPENDSEVDDHGPFDDEGGDALDLRMDEDEDAGLGDDDDDDELLLMISLIQSQ